MATGYYSRISNTVVSGSDLISTLSGKNVRDLEFAQSVANHDPVAVSTADVTLSTAMLVQAAVDRLLIDPSAVNTTSAALLLGSDTAGNAGAYIRLFNLSSTNQTRILKFVSSAATASGKILGLANNDKDSGSNVKVVTAAVDNGLFKEAAASGKIAGVERQVLVQGTTLTSGSEVVTFTILQAVNGVNCLSAMA